MRLRLMIASVARDSEIELAISTLSRDPQESFRSFQEGCEAAKVTEDESRGGIA